MTVRKAEIRGRAVVAPKLTQRRAMALGRQIVRVLGRPAIRLIGALVTVAASLQDNDATETETMIAMAHALVAEVPEDERGDLVDLLSSDAVDALILSIVDGATVGGVMLDRSDESTIDEAFADDVDPWALHHLAWWVCMEYRLFPLPGG